ncbi:hypothetical protein PLESTB_001086800 [Pleodorina starrii]|uniref:UDENN domain-containing protein n=1 Tax=Pleodorina starrii TaxID=330485 RepID=A0A9W6BRN1_9CHLO|nr:hypothetical protein PLESTM_000699500 [Pleodorina starrii]GLC56271.1 hypothetical protein PLESTB_001086800 [Pleodorina starrii]GLC69615.1 hypothetical protein PLESTF_000855200 [Pleodorina starrii]
MKNDSKRGEESTFTRWGKSIASAFKTTKKEVEKHEPSGPSINPEALTAQKREWIDSQAAQVQQTLATWPEHLFEHFFVIGLPPDIEVTQIAQDLWAQEVRQRQDGGGEPGASGSTAASTSTSGAAGSMAGAGGGGGGRAGSKPQQYDKAPRPAYDAQVLFRHPVAKAAPLNDQELVDLCFPHKVAPVKLRRSPSLSSLHEVVYGRHAAARDDQCFIFLLKVGTSLPLYGVCCAVPEVLHRPPHLARHLFPACRMPFRSVMISAPRVYCLLSHYPFFDLHFQVLNVILGMERLHRTIDFNAEMDSYTASSAYGAATSAATAAGATSGCGGGGGRGVVAGVVGKGSQQQQQQQQSQGQAHQSHNGSGNQTQQHRHLQQQQQQQRDAVGLSSRCYCADCAVAIADMYPGLMQPPREVDPLQRRHSRSGRPAAVAAAAAGRSPLDDSREVGPTHGSAAAPPQQAASTAIRTHGSVRLLSEPGSAGLPSSPLAAPSPAGPGGSSPDAAGEGGCPAVQVCCQACGRPLGVAPGAHWGPTGEVRTAHEQGLLEEATEALENALDKLALLPRAVAAGVTEAAAAAAAVLRRASPGAASIYGPAAAGPRPGAPEPLSFAVSAVGGAATGDDDDDGDGGTPRPRHTDSYLSSDMGTPHAALASSVTSLAAARALVAAPAEAASNLAHKVIRDTLKAFESGGDGGGGGGPLRDTAAPPLPDGLHIHRVGPEHGAFIAVNGGVPSVSPLTARRSALPPLEEGGSGDAAVAPPLAAARSVMPPPPPPLAAWHSSVAALGGVGGGGGGGLDTASLSLGGDPRAPSLVQQLMRSVMVPPLSPVTATTAAALAASEPYAAGGRGRSCSSASCGAHSAIQSPQLPSSPRQDMAAQQQQQQQQPPQQPPQHHHPLAGNASPRQVAPPPAGAAAAAAAAEPCSPTAAAAADGQTHNWSFLQRLGRLGSLPRSPGAEPPSGREKGRSEGGARASPPANAAAGGGRASASGGGGHGMASAFAVAIDLAAAVEQQIASPPTPLVYDAVAAAAAQSSDDWRLAAQPPPARCDPAAARDGAAFPPRPPPLPPLPLPCSTGASGGGGGHAVDDTASHYASLPHSGPTSRHVTAPGDATQGPGDGDERRAGEDSGTAEAVAAAAPPPSRQHLPPLATAASRLMAEYSGVSVNPSETSFYSAEGAEEDCTPREDADGADEAPSAASPSPAPAGEAAAPAPAAVTAAVPASAAHAAAAQPSSRRSSAGSGRPAESRLSVELPPPQFNGGVGTVVPVVQRTRGTPPLAPQFSVAAAAATATNHGGTGGTTGIALDSRPAPATVSLTALPSRLSRTSATFALGLGASADAAAFSPPQPPAAAAAAPPPLPPAVSSRRSGAAVSSQQLQLPAVAAAPPPPPLVATVSTAQLPASPPPAGVVVTSADMTHHFSPRRALDQLYDHPLVHPGEQLTLRFGGVATLSFTRPVLGRRFTVVGHPRAIQAYAEAELAEGLQHWTTAVLCRSLSLDNLLLVLTAALLERQVVVFCPAISVLSCCVLGLLPLLRPFGWQSLLLPVTPASMMGFLEAPVPFVLGVQYKTSDVMARCSHLIRVNVYKDQVKNAGAPLPQLPGLKRLAAALAPHHSLLRRRLAHQAAGGAAGGAGGGEGAGRGGATGSTAAAKGLGALLAGGGVPDVPADGGRSLRSLSPAEQSATSSFLSVLAQHLGSICGDLRPHVITNVGLAKRTGVLMKESLMEVIPPKDKPFVRQFIETQMFSVWSDALISANFEGSFAAT